MEIEIDVWIDSAILFSDVDGLVRRLANFLGRSRMVEKTFWVFCVCDL